MDIKIDIPKEEIRALIREYAEENIIPYIYKGQNSPTRFIHSIKDLADFLDCSPVTAQKLKNSGRIRYHQFGRKFIINSAELLEDISAINKRRN